MKTLPTIPLGGLVTFLFAVVAQAAPSAPVGPAMEPQRFELTYEARFKIEQAVPGTVTVYVPVPSDSEAQTVESFSLDAAPLEGRLKAWSLKREAEYGNRFLEATVENPAPGDRLALHYVVTRREVANPPTGEATNNAGNAPEARWLQPDRLVPLTGPIAEMAKATLAGAESDDARIAAIYAKTVGMMRYDKSGTGWGHGDVQWACDAKRGNCTDFHAVVIGMARASGMPARFEIGFPIPNDRAAGEIPGYHCWAFLFDRPRGWVPVDASEGWKNDGKYKDYYLGRIGSDRVAFSSGRDIKLGQHGAPLNYFVTPYAEQGEVGGFAPVPMGAAVSFKKLAKN